MTEKIQRNESVVWKTLEEIQKYIVSTLNYSANRKQEEGMERFNHDSWINLVWENEDFRRAHLDVVDVRSTKKLFMMHFCVFPHLNSDAPIFGFDVIAGENKMTGAFIDFSPTVNPDHAMITMFKDMTANLEWKRERELPDWAKAIFSDHMISAGNVKEQNEILQVASVATSMIRYYLSSLSFYNMHCKKADAEMVRDAHNRYAHYQKQNPHTPRVMKSLGLNENDVDLFVQKCLFPEI